MESHGVIGFDAKIGKVVGKSFGKTGYSDTEWSFVDGKLIEKITLNGVQNGEPRQFSFARSVRSVDENTMETTYHQVSDTGEVGEAFERDGAKVTQTWKRKK